MVNWVAVKLGPAAGAAVAGIVVVAAAAVAVGVAARLADLAAAVAAAMQTRVLPQSHQMREEGL